MMWPRSKGRRRVAEVRSSVGERSWSARSHFLEEGGRAVQLGTTHVGSRSPPMPAFMRPAPLSTTTTFDIFGGGGGFGVLRGFLLYSRYDTVEVGSKLSRLPFAQTFESSHLYFLIYVTSFPYEII